MIGGAIGYVVGLGIILSSADFLSLKNQQDRSGTILGLSVGGGMVLGALIGLRGDKRTIYPPLSERQH